MAITGESAGRTVPPARKSKTGGPRRRTGVLFALSILIATLAGLAILYVLVADPTTPSAYPGLNGFKKTGVLPTKADGDVVTFVFAFIVGFLIQRSRWCNASAIRDAILFRSFRNTKPLLAAMMIITVMFTVFEVVNIGQPINIVGGMFTVLGLFLFGIGMVLGGACTVSVWIRSAEGSFAALWALLYTFFGMFLFSELWNVLRWPAATYLQSSKPNWSILAFGSFNALSLRDAFGPVFGPVAVALAGAAQVAVLVLIYRKCLRIERTAQASQAQRTVPMAAVAAAAPAASATPATRVPAQAAASAADSGGGGSDDARAVDLPGFGAVRVDRVLDCSGEMCPRPQLFTKRVVVREMSAGEVLELVVDNPSSPDLVPTIMSDIGAEHLHTVRTGDNWKLYIRKEQSMATSKGGARE